jgi:hypothetical protein
MSPVEKRLIDPARRRSIPSTGFSWIDRRFVRDGFLDHLQTDEALVYLFLVAVSDRDGLSYYGDRTIAARLGITEHDVDCARAALQRHDLVRYRAPLYQVLSLPDVAPPRPRRAPPTIPSPKRLLGTPTSLADILKNLR